MEHLKTLKQFQKWRTGKDELTLTDSGLTPQHITACIDWAINAIESGKMTPIKELTDKHASIRAASRFYGSRSDKAPNQAQLGRLVKKGAYVDAQGQVWIKGTNHLGELV